MVCAKIFISLLLTSFIIGHCTSYFVMDSVDCSSPQQATTRATLEQHKADVVTTLFVPVFDSTSFPNHPEIYFKTDFREILRPLQLNKQTLPAEEEANEVVTDIVGDASALLLPVNRKRGSKRNNIIDELEKKYCGGHSMLDLGFEDRNELENTPPTTSEGAEGDGKKAKKRKRRSEQQADYYDMDDAFIDDSDCITEIQAQISGKYLKTKHRQAFDNVLVYLFFCFSLCLTF